MVFADWHQTAKILLHETISFQKYIRAYIHFHIETTPGRPTHVGVLRMLMKLCQEQ